ncbi:kinase-like domain-containing protein [Dichotomocladium elegans]|nr:kinase-like domain-containing protein [Dichotomocladium elegans]
MIAPLEKQHPQESNQHKNDIFFSTTGLLLPRPPPPLSPRREQQHSPTVVTSSPSRRTLALPPSVPSPVPNVYSESRSYSNDDIIPLPSPAPGNPSTPVTDNEQALPLHEQIIPVIVTSPTLSPGKKNKLPSLVEEPHLGDLEDRNNSSLPSARFSELMMREHKFLSPSPVQYTEENIVGKQIGEYRIGRMLGVGAFSKVYLAIKHKTPYAIKMISKKRIAEDARVRSSGGELFDFVQKMHEQLHAESKKVDEGLVRRIFLELVRVVQWLHEHNVVHRDLKLENILIHMDMDTGEPHLKVTDFGLARVIDPEAPTLTTRCGSEEYSAPEIVQGLGYDGRKTDTWALGVILYALLVGYLPFMYNPSRGEKVSHLFYRIISSDYRWPLSWQQRPELAVSRQARHVVGCMLQRNPDKRIALSDIERLDWLTPPVSYLIEKIS